MKFDDLNLLQQLTIVSQMLSKPNPKEIRDKHLFVDDGTGYAFDVSYLLYGNYTDLNISNHEYEVGISINQTHDDDEPYEGVRLSFGMNNSKPSDAYIDRFGIFTNIVIKGDLEKSLVRILGMIKELSKLSYVNEEAVKIINKVIELIPAARSLPEELFDRVYVDPYGAYLVDVIADVLHDGNENFDFEYRKENVLIEPYMRYSFLVSDITPTNNIRKSNDRQLCFGYGSSIDNIIDVRIFENCGDSVGKKLFSIKVTSDMTAEQVLDQLEQKTLAAVVDMDKYEPVLKLAKTYFKFVNEKRVKINQELSRPQQQNKEELC